MPKIPKKPAKPISIEDMNEAMSDASYMAGSFSLICGGRSMPKYRGEASSI